MANNSDITITSLETITAFDIVTGDLKFVLDELQSATISQSEEKTDITGKQGRKISSLKKNKAVTISGNNGMISSGLMELQTGSKFINKPTVVKWVDYLTVNNNKATTNYKAVGTIGNEINEIIIKNSDNTLGRRLTQVASSGSVATGFFTYDPATKELIFNAADVPNNTEIIVYYDRMIRGDVHMNLSDNYSGKCALYVDAFGEDKCANLYRIQFYIPKADFNGEFSIEMGENQIVHSFEAESLANSCSTSNDNGILWTYTVFGENAMDTYISDDEAEFEPIGP